MDAMRIRPILLIEDSPEDARVTKRAIARSGLHNPIAHCQDGEEALDYLCQRKAYAAPGAAARPELILLDLNLPGRDGRHILRQVKNDATLKTIPIVVLTTSDHEEDVEMCYAHGANSYVKKPVDFAGFMDAISRLADYWFVIALLPRGVDV